MPKSISGETSTSGIIRWAARLPLAARGLQEIMLRALNQVAENNIKRIKETCVKVGTKWKYLYEAVDSAGNTIEFMLSAKRDVSAGRASFSSQWADL